MWNKYIENNKFTNGDESDRENYGKIDTFYTSPLINFERQFDWEITNNVDELKVKDVVSEYIRFRHPQSEAVNHVIQFEAVKEGAFNLVIGSYRLPIIIHPQNTSIRKKVTLVMGQQWENSTTASFSLPHGYNAVNENMEAILRVGDIIHCTFMEYAQNKQDPLKIELVIEINKEKLQ